MKRKKRINNLWENNLDKDRKLNKALIGLKRYHNFVSIRETIIFLLENTFQNRKRWDKMQKDFVERRFICNHRHTSEVCEEFKCRCTCNGYFQKFRKGRLKQSIYHKAFKNKNPHKKMIIRGVKQN